MLYSWCFFDCLALIRSQQVISEYETATPAYNKCALETECFSSTYHRSVDLKHDMKKVMNYIFGNIASLSFLRHFNFYCLAIFKETNLLSQRLIQFMLSLFNFAITKYTDGLSFAGNFMYLLCKIYFLSSKTSLRINLSKILMWFVIFVFASV